jgi:hypothetical protein
MNFLFLVLIVFLCIQLFFYLPRYIIRKIRKNRAAKHKLIEERLEQEEVPKIATARFEQLKELDYFRFMLPADIESHKPDLLEWLRPSNRAMTGPLSNDTKYVRGVVEFSEDNRSISVDGENLAEGDIQKTIEAMQIFKQLDIHPVIKSDLNTDDHTYGLVVDGKSYRAYGHEQVESRMFWGTATLCLQVIVNDLLEAAGLNDRLYTLYTGGNEGLAVVLTPDQRDLLLSFGKEQPSDEQDNIRDLKFDPRK